MANCAILVLNQKKEESSYVRLSEEREHEVGAGGSSAPRISLKLDALQLPTFNGDLTTWIAFRDQYMDLVHNNPNLTSVIKFHLLKTHLRGLASDAINGFKLSSSDYKAAWFVLTKRYDQKIIDEYINKFSQLPPLPANRTAAQLINMANRATGTTRTWCGGSRLGSLNKWVDQVKKRENVPLAEFLEFLEIEASERVTLTYEQNRASTSYPRQDITLNSEE